MKIELKDIFQNTLNSLNLTILEEQEEPIFKLINMKYFSIVKPLSKKVNTQEIEISVDSLKGMEINKDSDPINLGIGSYKVFEVVAQRGGIIKLRTEPIDFNDYKISLNYTDTYQTVCEAILERFEAYNMQTLKGIGVEDIENRLDINYEYIEQLIYKKHNLLAFDGVY